MKVNTGWAVGVIISFVLLAVVVVAVGSSIEPPKQEDRVKTACFTLFFYPVWRDSLNWAVAVDKMKTMIEWRECEGYLMEFIKQEVEPRVL